MGWCRCVGPISSQCHPGTAEGSSNGKIGPFVGDVTQLGRKDPSKDPSDPFSTHQALTKKRFRVVQSSESIAADCSSLQVTGVRKYDKQYIYIYTHIQYTYHTFLRQTFVDDVRFVNAVEFGPLRVALQAILSAV